MKTLKAAVKTLLLCMMITALIGGLGYIALGYYYRDGFSYGTYINGVYCTGKSVEEVNTLFAEGKNEGTVTLKVGDREYTFSLDDVNFKVDYTKPLQEYINTQNPYLWIENMMDGAKNKTINGDVSVDEALLAELFEKFSIKKLGIPHALYLKATEKDGYILYDGKGNIVDIPVLIEVTKASILEGKYEIIADESCYKKAVYSDYEKELIELYALVDKFQSIPISYNILNNNVLLTKTQVASMLSLNETGKPYRDEAGNLVFDENSVFEGLSLSLNPYKTYHNHTFTTHEGKKVYLDDGTYGTDFSIKDEAKMLFAALKDGEKSYSSTPVLKREAKYKGPDDIGKTYLEISLDEQHMYYFEEGVMVLDTDIVTGNHARRHDTPEGVDYVYFKQRNRTLIGEDYESFVKYWIAFIRHIGVHDASWRKEYGGDIYLRGGSHGCVNTPEEKVSKLYDMIEVGTPVIVYSYENSLVEE